MPQDDLLTSAEVADRLGVGARTVRRWVTEGRLKPTVTTFGGRYRFRWADVERQLREHNETRSDDTES